MKHTGSFFLYRPGLKDGYLVPYRLRIADAIFIWVDVPIFLCAIGLLIVTTRSLDSLGVEWVSGGGLFSMYAWLAILSACFWSVRRPTRWAIRRAIILVGMVTNREEDQFPLAYDWPSVDPWPESWQVKRDRTEGTGPVFTLEDE